MGGALLAAREKTSNDHYTFGNADAKDFKGTRHPLAGR
jgi:hypothetical protein